MSTLGSFSYKNKLYKQGRHFLIALLLFFSSTPTFANSEFNVDSLSTTRVWIAAQLIPGSGQVINKQYWKVPVFYAGIGTMVYFGNKANIEYKNLKEEFKKPIYSPDEELFFKERWTPYKVERNLFYVSALSIYLASVADAMVVHSKGRHSPTTATVFSALIPGMGQVYNQKLWKVPFIFGGIATLYYVVDFNQRGYKRFGDAYRLHPLDEFNGLRTRDELKYFRDAYRRNRDLSIISLFAFYVLNIIDANVDAHFFDWDISDNLALNLEPIIDGGRYSLNNTPSTGFKLTFNF